MGGEYQLRVVRVAPSGVEDADDFLCQEWVQLGVQFVHDERVAVYKRVDDRPGQVENLESPLGFHVLGIEEFQAGVPVLVLELVCRLQGAHHLVWVSFDEIFLDLLRKPRREKVVVDGVFFWL